MLPRRAECDDTGVFITADRWSGPLLSYGPLVASTGLKEFP